MFEDWTLTFKNLVLPIFCKQCGCRLLTDENRFFCPTCWGLSPRIRPPLCSRCGKPHERALGFSLIPVNYPCEECRAKSDRSVRFTRIVGAAYYQDAIAEAVKLFKFGDRSFLAGPLAELMAECACRELHVESYDYLVPVPLYPVRRRARGYNQSELLARALIPEFPHAALDQSLKRIRPTRTQSLIKSDAERRDNVRGAFAVRHGEHLVRKQVLLIDDVVTSGGTVNECAAVLRRAGVTRVDVLSAALAVTTRNP